ncbi:MAG: alkaline phosphatase D family protein [Phycisphaeraceae bacterium]
MGADRPIQTIAFASCAKPNQPETIWQSVLATEPDLFLFIGDNVYVDQPRKPKGVEDFERTYAQLASEAGWQKLVAEVPVLATWDDHDYGLNDAGKEFPLKQIAQQQFADFFALPKDSPVRQREGIYDAHLFGPAGQRVQVILLDTRYFRDALKRNPKGRGKGRGPYIANPDEKATLLGDAQWAWLEQQLKQPAQVRVIASSIQVVPEENGWEVWGNFPHERDRLYALIGSTKANGVVFISGDRHLTEISRDVSDGVPYPMWDFTSSGMNEGGDRRVDEPNKHRVSDSRRVANFGVITIDWEAESPALTYETRGKDGGVILKQVVPLSKLKAASQR